MTSLRLATPDDGAAVAAIYNPVIRDTTTSFETVPVTAGDMADRIAATVPTWPWLVADRDDEVLGYAYAGRHRARPAYAWSVEVSVYLDADTRRQGLGRALYTALLDLLAAQGYANAYAGITLPNPASAALHEAVGFTHLGTFTAVGHKHGRWCDVGWWQRPLGDDGAAPSPPTPLTELPDGMMEVVLAAGLATIAGRPHPE